MPRHRSTVPARQIDDSVDSPSTRAHRIVASANCSGTAGSKRRRDLWKKRSLQVIEVDHKVVASLTEMNLFQIVVSPGDINRLRAGAPPRRIQGYRRNVYRGDIESLLPQEDRVPAFAAGEIEGAAGPKNLPKLLKYGFEKRARALVIMRRRVRTIPSLPVVGTHRRCSN